MNATASDEPNGHTELWLIRHGETPWSLSRQAHRPHRCPADRARPRTGPHAGADSRAGALRPRADEPDVAGDRNVPARRARRSCRGGAGNCANGITAFTKAVRRTKSARARRAGRCGIRRYRRARVSGRSRRVRRKLVRRLSWRCRGALRCFRMRIFCACSLVAGLAIRRRSGRTCCLIRRLSVFLGLRGRIGRYGSGM